MNEIIAKKIKWSAILILIMGVVLILGAVGCFVASALHAFDIGFLATCISCGSFGAAAIGIGIAQTRVPKDLIALNHDGFFIIQTGELIPFAAIVRVASKFSDRRIILTLVGGFDRSVDLVSGYKQVKHTIAQIVKEKTGNDITVL